MYRSVLLSLKIYDIIIAGCHFTCRLYVSQMGYVRQREDAINRVSTSLGNKLPAVYL